MIAIEYEAELSKLEQRIEELLEHNQELERCNQELERRNQELEQENRRLREMLNAKGESKASKKPKFKLKYSLEKNPVKRKRRHPSTGRRQQIHKLGLVSHTEDIYPPTVKPEDCVPQRKQYAWRIVEGKATYICYTIYGRPDSKSVANVPGLQNSRSEYGLEIILIVAFLHYWIGISLDHVCDVLRFFTGLDLSKSQADSVLNQLSQDWAQQYDTIAELLALQLVIYIDETGWKVGARSCYTWAFSTAMHVLFRCGVGRGQAEAQAILGDQFGGIGVTDDYGAYKHLFKEHQLCWAHLLCKAIKLMLQQPDEAAYARFVEELYAIYQQAVRWQRDQRLSVGRPEKAKQLQARILALCTRAGEAFDAEQTPAHVANFIRLQNELVKSLESLFVFVEHPEVEPTNNRSERNIRREAEIRKGGRTSKSEHGAQRRSIIMTVLATLNTRFKKFTLDNLLAEVARWLEIGRSTFQLELAGMQKANAPPVA